MTSSERVRTYLHVGTHKTGTTAIQRFSNKNKEELKRQGILYPSVSPVGPGNNEAHHFLAHVIAGQIKGYSPTAIQSMVNAWVDEAASNNAALLVSAEAIWRHTLPVANKGETGDTWIHQRRKYLRTLASYFDDRVELIPVVVLRRPDDFLESLYKERIMKGLETNNRSFMQFVESMTARHLRYFDNLALVEDVVGPPMVMTYEDLAESGDLVRSFFRYIGINLIGEQSTDRVRVSLTPVEAMAKLYLDSREHDKKNREALEFVKTSVVNERLTDANQQRFGFWPTRDARIRFLDRFQKETEAIRARWLPERPYLFPQPTTEEMGVEPAPPVDDQVKELIEQWLNCEE